MSIKPLVYRFLRFFGHQEWIRYILRDKVIRFLVNPDKCPFFEFEADLLGLRYKGNLNRYLDWCIYFFGAYEKQELLLLKAVLEKKGGNAVFVDIGANTGEYSLFLSGRCKAVHAFEPFDAIADKFRKEIELNRIGNISIHEAGMGDENKELDFYAPVEGNCNTGTGSFLSTHERENNRLYKKLKVMNADEYLEKLGLPGLDLIKIDVEGFEKNVLKGLQGTMKKHRPVIFMEFSKTTSESFASFDEFRALIPGYRISRITYDIPLLFFFNKPAYKLVPFSGDRVPANLLLEPLR